MWSTKWLCHFNPFNICFYNNISWSASCELMTLWRFRFSTCMLQYPFDLVFNPLPESMTCCSCIIQFLLSVEKGKSFVGQRLLPVWPLWLILNFPMERIGSGIIKTGLMVWWWSLWIWGYRSFLWLASSRFLSYAGAESSTSSRRICRLSWCPHMRQTTNLLKQQAVNIQGMCSCILRDIKY